MGLLLPILVGFLASLIGGLYLLGVFRKRRPGEPPLDKGLIPWLGHVLEFRRDTLKFLERMKQKHGDVFTVQLGGLYFTFLQDPLSFGAFVKESREKLDFNNYARQLVRKVFGYIGIEEEYQILHMSTNKNLKGEGLEKMKVKDNISRWVWDIQQAKEEFGMDESMINRYMFVLLWGAQGNTGPSSFWLLLFLMKHPEAMKAVKEEVDKVLKKSGQEVTRGGPLVDLTRDMLMKMPVLDSAVEETLRLTTAPLLMRAVMQDTAIKMADGHEFLVRKGDRMAIFPYSAVHIDPEIHPDPHSFKYDRFLNPEGKKKTDFYKGGKKVKYFYMPWGAGVSMCPGRFLATNELKQFAFLMLVYFDFELKNPDEKIPEIDYSRWGFGSMHPQRDIQFRYRLRY
eukprot:superscaffoldBa00000942_g8110